MKISIIGAAGYVGSNVAFTLALFGLADEIVLIDPYKPNLVTHFAMDGNTAVAEKGVLLRAGDYDEMQGSNIVIMAAGAPQGLIASRMEMLPKNLPIIQDIAGKIKKSCPDSIVITATNPVDPLNYAMYLFTGFDRRKIIGYTTNDSTRFRMMVAQALGYGTGDVDGVVVGEHGESQTLLFSSVKIKGKYVKLDKNTKERIRAQIPNILRTYEEMKTGRTAGLTSATGMKRIIEAIVNNSNKVIPCSAILDGEYGCQDLSMGVPAVLGSGGIHKIMELEIAADEKPYLDNTLKVLNTGMRLVDDYIKTSRSG